MVKIKKKVLLSSLAFAMVTTSTLFSMHRVYGESTTDAGTSSVVKAILTKDGSVKGRDASNTATSTTIAIDTVTDLLIDYQVTEITEGKFNGKTKLTKLVFNGASTEDTTTPSQVTKIGKNAFKGTGITNVILPKSLTTIEESAFASTTSLTTVDFKHSKNLENIGKWAFVSSGLTTLDLSPMNTGSQTTLAVGEGAFRKNAALTSVTLSSKMTNLMLGTFSLTKITTIDIAESITTIHPATFRETPLAKLTVNEGNTTFEAEDNVLYNKGKTNLYLYPEGKTGDNFTIPNTVTTVKEYAFSSSPTLTNVVVGEALINIDLYAFEKTAKLTTLDLRNAKALINIGNNAFNESLLSSMIISSETGALTTIGANAFGSTTTSKTVSFKKNDGSSIIDEDLTSLVKKYKRLKETTNGSWTLESKFSTPIIKANYETMELTGFVPEAIYTIQGKEYTIEGSGIVSLPKTWSGQTLSIVRKATSDQEKSDAQELKINGIYSVYIDDKEIHWKIEGATVHVTAPVKTGHQFTTWESSDVTSTTISGNKISFTMPPKDVRLVTQYTEISIETPVDKLIFDGKKDVPITIVSTLFNFDKLKVDTKELVQDKDYTVSGGDKTTITLKKEYLDTLTVPTSFEVTFKEGGTITFSVRLYGPAPVAVPNYQEMKLTQLEKNTQYKINDTVMASDAQGMIAIDRSWGGQTLEIIKVGTGTATDSKPQNLNLKTFYTISVNGKELGYTAEGSEVTVKAAGKDEYNFKEWTAIGVVLSEANKKEMTFTMPASDVALTIIYTHIITSKPEEMVYNGEDEVIIRFDLPITDFKDIEYNGKKLVKNVDYIATSGSTIITFTKTFLDKMNGDMHGLKALFTDNTVVFTIKHEIAPPIQPVPPLVDPRGSTTNPVTPKMQPVPAKLKIQQPTAKSPTTADTTNMFLLFTIMLVSAGAFIVAKKRNS